MDRQGLHGNSTQTFGGAPPEGLLIQTPRLALEPNPQKYGRAPNMPRFSGLTETPLLVLGYPIMACLLLNAKNTTNNTNKVEKNANTNDNNNGIYTRAITNTSAHKISHTNSQNMNSMPLLLLLIKLLIKKLILLLRLTRSTLILRPRYLVLGGLQRF